MRIMQRIDDLDYAGVGKFPAKTETAATHTVKLTWQVDGGKPETAELDLSDEHLAEYGQHMFVLLHAYQVNNPKSPVREEPEDDRVPRPPDDADLSQRRRYRKSERKFADRYGIKALDMPERPAYKTATGNWQWPKWLDRAYDHWLATGEVVLPRPKGEDWRETFRKLDEAMQDGGSLNDPMPDT